MTKTEKAADDLTKAIKTIIRKRGHKKDIEPTPRWIYGRPPETGPEKEVQAMADRLRGAPCIGYNPTEAESIQNAMVERGYIKIDNGGLKYD